jgi:hypothetical protein
MRYVRYVAIAVFTFVIGMAISPIRFYGESIACGPHNSTTVFRSSYFIQTSFSHVAHPSDLEASEAFNQQLKEAVRIIEVSPKVNKDGVLIEQRAVAVFYNAGTGEYYASVFWRDGRMVHGVFSRSLTHVLDFEKQNF